jgi:hypothetical protein
MQATLETGLQAFYKLSDTSDSSGNNRTLTNNGNVSFASGKLGNAANLLGQQSLEATINEITDSSSGSYSCWVNRNGIEEWPLCSIKAFGTSLYFDAYNTSISGEGAGNGGGPDGRLNCGSVLGEHSVNLNATDWAHFVLTYDITTQEAKCYANGEVFFTGSTESLFSDSNFILGYGDGHQGKGLVDAVGIWNRALSDAEVAELYNNGTGLELPAPVGPTIKNGWIDNIYWINDVATTLDQNGDGTWVGKLYENGSLFSGSKYSLTFVDGVAQAEQIVTVIGSNIPVAFGLNEAEEPLVELVFASITSAGETTVEQIIPTVLPTGYTVAETVLAYSIDTTATFEGSINVDFILPSNTSQTVFDRVKCFHVKDNGSIEEMARVSSDFSTKRITVAITSFSDFLFLDQPATGKLVKIQGNVKFYGNVKFAG